LKIVVGAAGFIGFHLTNALLDRGHQVLAVDSFDDLVYSESKKRMRSDLLIARGIEVIEPKAGNSNWMSRIGDGDSIFNLAATPGLSPSWTSPMEYLRNNTLLVAEILEYLVNSKIRATLVQASTSSVYGEFASGVISQSKQPTSPYGYSKLAAENLIELFSKHYEIKARVLRLFSVFGPHQRPDQFFAIAMRKISSGQPLTVFGDGKNSRTNVYVKDAVEAFINADGLTELFVEADVAGSESVSSLEVIELVSSELGRPANIVFGNKRLGDQRETIGDLADTKNKIHWEPKTTFKEGIQATVAHFKEHPEFY
jgi:nucleoside-diphosphate-sugar epimerase